MRKFLYGAMSITLAFSPVMPIMATPTTSSVSSESQITAQAINISLSDDGILVDGQKASTSSSDAIYTSHDIIYYEDKDTYDSGNTYGEGTTSDKHTAEEAAKHTVVNITKAGTYRLSGKLSYGQIFVNVGKEEADQVTLIFDNADINCDVAPAVLFYNVYECDKDASAKTASNKVDTSKAGARVIIADDSVNHIVGSHVSKIYKDNADQKKLHKYDAAFYSRMSMEIDGEEKGNGILNITSDNEGLDTELHLTINGGHINIQSKDDGINVNEDGVSVFTMNDGYLNIYAGNGVEGDGIDSNGWNVINGGTIISMANPKSMDGGIDSDMGTIINGGTVIGAGNMYDPIEDSSSSLFMVLELAKQSDALITVTDERENPVFAFDFPANYNYIVFSTPTLTEGTYHAYEGGSIIGTQMDGFYSTITSYTKGTALHHGGASKNGIMRPEMSSIPNANGNTNGQPPAIPDDSKRPELPSNMQKGERPELPEGVTPTNEPPALPEGMDMSNLPTPPAGGMGGGFGGPQNMTSSSETESYDFVLSASSKKFTNVSSTEIKTSTN